MKRRETGRGDTPSLAVVVLIRSKHERERERDRKDIQSTGTLDIL